MKKNSPRTLPPTAAPAEISTDELAAIGAGQRMPKAGVVLGMPLGPLPPSGQWTRKSGNSTITTIWDHSSIRVVTTTAGYHGKNGPVGPRMSVVEIKR